MSYAPPYRPCGGGKGTLVVGMWDGGGGGGVSRKLNGGIQKDDIGWRRQKRWVWEKTVMQKDEVLCGWNCRKMRLGRRLCCRKMSF